MRLNFSNNLQKANSNVFLMQRFELSLNLQPQNFMRMLNSIRHSVLCKCFRFFLLGYFLLSTINISGNLYHHCNHETKICSFFDKMFKWNKYSNELEETKTKEAKGVKFVKEISILEFLIPFGTSLNSYLFQNTLSKKFNLEKPVFLFGFCREIHLPPPQFFV